jgi:hypothetical protein
MLGRLASSDLAGNIRREVPASTPHYEKSFRLKTRSAATHHTPNGECQMNNEKRIEYKQRFLDLVGLSDQELDKKLSGRQKYCPRCLQPLPFEGLSVVHNISHEDAKKLGLTGMIESVILDMSIAGLEQKVAFVSTDSFHATTFDLINHGEHSQTLAGADFVYEQVRADVEKAALAFMSECAPLVETITIAGLGMFCPQVLKLDLSISQDVLNRFQIFRRKLHVYLCDKVNGYSTVRERDWDSKLSGHLTFGYFVNPLQEREIEALLDCLIDFNQRFTPIEFQLTQGEVTRFSDMDHYEVVQGGRLLATART